MYENIKNSSQFYNYSMMFKYFKQSLEILKDNNDFIKSYINIKKEYYQKLLNLKQTNDFINNNNKDNTNSIKNLISDITDILSKILDIEIESNKFLIEEIEPLLDETDCIIDINKSEEKDIMNKFLIETKEIIENKENIKKFEINFHNNASNVENSLINIYLDKKKNLSSNTIVLNNKDFELINESFDKMKKSEKEYLNFIEKINQIENNFEINTKKYYHNEKEKSFNIILHLKQLIINLLIFLKNSFQFSFTEIEQKSKNLYSYDIKLNLDKFLNKILKKIEPIKSTKYINYKYISYKDKLNYLNDLNLDKNQLNIEEKFNIIKLINSQLIIKHNLFDENIEKEIIIVNNITNKILNFNKSNYLPPNEIEINKMLNLCKKNTNINVFLDKLNLYRSKGNFSLPKVNFKIIVNILNTILDNINIEIDIDIIKSVIILSQTYYEDNNKNLLLQKKIIDNKIFKNSNLWEKLLENEIENSLKKNNINLINAKIENNNLNKNEIDLKIANIAFCHIITILKNMLDFECNKEMIYNIINPKIKKYNLDKNLILTINSMLETKEFDSINNFIEEDKNYKNNK